MFYFEICQILTFFFSLSLQSQIFLLERPSRQSTACSFIVILLSFSCRYAATASYFSYNSVSFFTCVKFKLEQCSHHLATIFQHQYQILATGCLRILCCCSAGRSSDQAEQRLLTSRPERRYTDDNLSTIQVRLKTKTFKFYSYISKLYKISRRPRKTLNLKMLSFSINFSSRRALEH